MKPLDILMLIRYAQWHFGSKFEYIFDTTVYLNLAE